MSKHIDKRENSGFSLVETLAAVAIIVILLSLSMVGAAYYRDLLKITELDNAAREIYMAAENRAVLLGNGGQLDGALGGASTLADGGGEGSRRYIRETDTAIIEDLLPAGTVDPALLKGDFYIVYDPASGAVTDVFYTEKETIQNIDAAFSMAGDRDQRMRATPMLGYYGGKHTARVPYLPLSVPEVMVEIHNGERLWVDVTFTIDDAATREKISNWQSPLSDSAKKTVRLKYGDKEITLMGTSTPDAPSSGRNYSIPGVSTNYITYRWILDSLDGTTEAEKNRHFYQLFGDDSTAYGGDFTVTAEIELSVDGYMPTSASGSDTDNSLFGEHSSGSTARIENLRHLQNLDADTSKAGDKTAAIQLADIHCYDNDTYKEYEFIPIENPQLESFNGGWNGEKERNEILNLHVTGESAAGKAGAGLFSTAEETIAFNGVRLIDAEVTGGASQPAGALTGATKNGLQAKDVWAVNASVHATGASAGGIAGSVAGTADFSGCRVYWEPEAGQENLRSLLGSDKTAYQYKITGREAGGLIGRQEKAAGSTATNPKDSISISKSFAASTVQGAGWAGGLIGYSESAPITLENAYADCYLSGARAAGLIGYMTTGTKITNCYAAGFIDMKTAAAIEAAGLCMGNSSITATGVYSVMSRVGGEGTYYAVCPQQTNSTCNRTYYINNSGTTIETNPSDGDILGYTYEEMSASGFAAEVSGGTGAFVRKGYKTPSDSQNTYPYNLHEEQSLDAYDFPGLNGLPHYGDWQAYFKEPSLVYYEKYVNNANPAFSGGNARTLVGELENSEKVFVESDGYAVALLQSDLGELANEHIVSFEVTYTYLAKDASGSLTKKTTTVEYKRDELLEATWNREDGGKIIPEKYYLAPLPKEILIGAETIKDQPVEGRTGEDFYQYLRFEISGGKTNSGAGLPSENFFEGRKPSGEFFYNPHFAETVKPYAPADDTPLVDWTAITNEEEALAAIQNYIAKTLAPKGGTVSASVRAPRHLYDLSLYRDYYHNEKRSLAFRQELDLDYSKYTEYGFAALKKEGAYTLQNPIGTQDTPFRGSYNGGCHTIENVVFELSDATRVCMGLFGCSNGTLSNIVYKLDPQKTVERRFQGREAYFGALVGINANTVTNCAVEGVNFRVRAYDSVLYIGGLAGVNENTIENCGVELASLSVDASQQLPVYAGGLAGRNTSSISRSYAVGRLSGKSEESNTQVSVCGFVCWNNGRIRNSYAAMDLKADGAGARVRGFCDPDHGVGSQTNTFYLNNGNFSYRKEPFLADYDAAANGAKPWTYTQLTNPDVVDWMPMYTRPSGQPFDQFPYPTGVTNGKGEPVHYGDWPKPLELGSMGVYYWEELYNGGKSTYHVSLLAVDPGKTASDPKTVSKISTLSTAYNSGGEVRRFGYGYYNQDGCGVDLVGKPTGGSKDESYMTLLYSGDGKEGTPFTEVYKELEEAKKNDKENNQDNPDGDVDDVLEELMSKPLGGTFQFHSFHSFGLDQAKGGLYPSGEGENAPNATLTLEQNGTYQGGAYQEVKVIFLLNPHFADALAVKKPDDGKQWKEEGVRFVSDNKDDPYLPGAVSNPYGVRSIAQLQLIDWNKANRNVDTVVEYPSDGKDPNIVEFPYLTSLSSPGSYHWKQTFDILGERDGNGNYKAYSPIAEYYTPENTRAQSGVSHLYGWFGGTYNGGRYKIENVNITGQRSSTVGLFGAVYNGKLEDIILYSSDGKGMVTTKARDTGEYQTDSHWIAIGALAGVVGASDGGNAITNCAVAGYTIDAQLFTHRRFGGSNVGGLVGTSHMNLSGCSAVVDIKIGGITSTTDEERTLDNTRVGGLAGVCQGTLTNCYAGGSISIDNKLLMTDGNYIYAGSLVGGSYINSLQTPDNKLIIGSTTDRDTTNNTLINCYSFVKLPPIDAHKSLRSLYVIGGTGEIEGGNQAHTGHCTIDNCYYLTSEVLANYGGTEEGYRNVIGGKFTDINNGNAVGLNYEQLSGKTPVTGNSTVYQLLNNVPGLSDGEARETGPFYPVSTKDVETNITVPGKYSYPPSTSPELAGLDYPFPTILTKPSEVEGTDYHVHYGRWPLGGFSRVKLDKDEEGKDVPLGSSPILVDLFGGEVYRERLVLADKELAGGRWTIPTGTQAADGTQSWSFSKDGKEVATAVITPIPGSTMEFELAVTGVSEGVIPLNLTYTQRGIPYSIQVSVHVSAGIKLLPSTVYLFPNDTATVGVKPASSTGAELKPDAGSSLELRLSEVSASYLEAVVQNGEGGPALQFTTTDAPREAATVSPEFTYTVAPDNPDGKKSYQGFSPIQVEILPSPEVKFEKKAVEGGEQTVCTITFNEYSLKENEGDIIETLDTLHFQVGGVFIANAAELADADAPVWSIAPDGKSITLSYPLAADLTKDVKLAVTVTMTGENGLIIPAGESQIHQVTLTLNSGGAAEGQLETRAMDLPDALPPAEDAGDQEARRRRWKRKYQRRRALARKP